MGKEGEVQRLILEYLTLKGLKPRRYANRVVYLGGKPFVPIRLPSGKADNGHPDIGVRTKDSRIWVECKAKKGAQSPEQKEWQREVESLGEIYILARSVEDVAALFEGR